MNYRAVSLGVTLAAGFTLAALAAESTGAKALFCSDTAVCSPAGGAVPAKPQGGIGVRSAPPLEQVALGLSYWVSLQQPSGELQRVSTASQFNTGDRIRLSFRPNRPGYLYVFGLGTSGRTTPLFPRGDEVARTESGQTVHIPGKSFLRFTSPPGEEILLVVFSPTPISDFASSRPATAENSAVVAIADSRGSKDLLRDDDFDSPAATKASYAVVPAGVSDRAINLSIKLRHR